ncbi:Os07g0471050 [Oryza sativa Japonica Group]|uniref:Os07g0471050 protein n=1 Tax=Oryza sativa subsp. japonica TaxID=39947 RepID=A0A0P0X5Z2_ORYSJ|nr:hypothetical protein EE612_039124 [Oryza sativa]BAT01422.1 Os07g0471050 [Oryza sativa Japonica Group]
MTRPLVSRAARGARSTSSPRRRSRAAAKPLLRWETKRREEAQKAVNTGRLGFGWRGRGRGFYPPASGKSAMRTERPRQEEGEGADGESETPSSAAHRRRASICGGGGGGNTSPLAGGGGFTVI